MLRESENEGNIEESAEGEMNSSEVEQDSASFGTNRKMIKRTIVALLETFSRFKTPKTVFMEREIRDLYDEVGTNYLFKQFPRHKKGSDVTT